MQISASLPATFRVQSMSDADDGWREYDPLGDIKPEMYIPPYWTPEHVGVRIVEAFEVVAMLPKEPGPAQIKSCMPAYAYEWSDKLAQSDLTPAERAERERERNRIQIPPSLDQLTRLDKVNRWIWLMQSGGQNVAEVRDWAVARVRGDAAEWWPGKELEWLANALNVRREAVF